MTDAKVRTSIHWAIAMTQGVHVCVHIMIVTCHDCHVCTCMHVHACRSENCTECRRAPVVVKIAWDQELAPPLEKRRLVECPRCIGNGSR